MGRFAWLVVAIALTSCEREVTRLEIHPKNPPADAALADPALTGPMIRGCPVQAIRVGRAGTWIGDAGRRRFAAACGGGAPDVAAVAAELCARDFAPRCTFVEVGAETGVAYQSLISVMDAAAAAGLTDVGVTSPDQLSVSFPALAAAADRLAAACGQPVPRCPRPATTTGVADAGPPPATPAQTPHR